MNRKPLSIILILLVVVNIICAAVLINRLDFFTFTSGDEFSKAIFSWNCRSNPISSLHSIWLPLHFWILLIGFQVLPDPILTPALINVFFSCATAAVIFALTWVLSGRKIFPTVLAVLLYIAHPFFAAFGISGYEMTIYFFFTLFAIFSTVEFFLSDRRHWLFLSALFFLLSSAIRYEGWIFTGIFVFLLVVMLIKKRGREFLPYLFAILISCSFVVFWGWWQHAAFGHTFSFVNNQYLTGHNERSNYNIRNLGVPGIMKLFLQVSFSFFGWLLVIFSGLGIFHALKDQRRKVAFMYCSFLFLGFVVLGVLTSLRLGGSWIEKQVAIFLLLLLPLAAVGISYMLTFKHKRFLFVPVLLGIFFLFRGFYISGKTHLLLDCSGSARQTAIYLRGMKLGQMKKALLQVRASAQNEENLYDSYFIMGIQPDFVLSDRDPHYRKKEGKEYLDTSFPSKFDLPSEQFMSFLQDNNVSFVVVLNEDTKKKLDALPFTKLAAFGKYQVYFREKK